MSNENVSINRQKTPEEIEKKHEEKLKRLELSRLEIHYRISKKEAKQEDKLDYDGEENVSINGRERFFQVLKKADYLGKYIQEKDLLLIKNAMYTHEDFVDKEKLKFLIDISYKNGGLAKVEETVDDLISLLRETTYFDSLQNFKKWINAEKIVSKIRQLSKTGLNTDQISSKLHITSAEVKILTSSSREMPKIFDEESR